MIIFLMIKKIEGALRKTRIVQEGPTIQSPGAQVDKVEVKTTPEKAAKEATTEEGEEHRVETEEEVQKVRLKAEDFLPKLNVSAAEARITKLWNVTDFQNIVAPDVRIAESYETQNYHQRRSNYKFPKRNGKGGNKGKRVYKRGKELMQWKLNRLLLYL